MLLSGCHLNQAVKETEYTLKIVFRMQVKSILLSGNTVIFWSLQDVLYNIPKLSMKWESDLSGFLNLYIKSLFMILYLSSVVFRQATIKYLYW